MTAVLRPHPHALPEVLDILTRVHRQTTAAAGTLSHSVGATEQGEVLVVERYVDRDACDAHFASPYVRDFMSRFAELLSAPPVLHIGEEHLHWAARPYPGTPA